MERNGASKRSGGAVRDYLEASSEKKQTAALLVVVVADAGARASEMRPQRGSLGGGDHVSVVEEARGGEGLPESAGKAVGDRDNVASNTDSLGALVV